jgi:hypothetical protein
MVGEAITDQEDTGMCTMGGLAVGQRSPSLARVNGVMGAAAI